MVSNGASGNLREDGAFKVSSTNIKSIRTSYLSEKSRK